MPTDPRFINLTGKTFSRLTVVEYAGRVGKKQVNAWRCRCVDGNEAIVDTTCLRSGMVRSCGCLLLDFIRTEKTTHGESLSVEHAIWSGMKTRCSNPRVKSFERYGGRGIKVCKRWRESYEDFLADMGRRPSPHHSIERRNNNRGYSPSNCYWATRAEQNRNTRLTRRIKFKGRTMSVHLWSAELGIPALQINKRLGRGWTINRALTQPLRSPR